MHIVCAIFGASLQVLDVLKRHGIRRGISWHGPDRGDTSYWIVVNASIDPTVEAALRRDIAATGCDVVQG